MCRRPSCPCRHLSAVGLTETLPDFIAAAKEVTVDEAAVAEAVAQDKAAEAAQQRAAGQRGGGKV